MAQVSVLPARDDLPRGGAAREVAGLASAMAVLTLNHATTQAKLEASGAMVSPTLAFFYTITGQILQMTPVANLFDLTGLTPVQPGQFQKYLCLVDREENPRVQEAMPARDFVNVSLANLSPNPYEAVVDMLNADPGWAVVGGVAIHVADTSLTPFTPGVDALAIGAVLDFVEFIDGFDGTVMLPVVSSGTTAPTVGVF
jgi:hypothetical protein